MKEQELKSLLEGIQVQPSARCWEAIESNIAAGAATGASAAASSSTATTATISTAAKVIIGGAAAAVAASGIILGITLSNRDVDVQFADNQHNTESIMAITDTALSNQEEDVLVITGPSEAVAVDKQSDVVLVAIGESEPVPAPAINLTSNEPVVVAQDPATAAPAAVSPAQTPQSSSKTTENQSVVQNNMQKASAGSKPSKGQNREQKQQAATEETAADDNSPVVEYAKPIMLEIPNVFTPNGDGYNDFFVISGIEHCDKTKLIVRTRGGNVVFQCNNYQNNWDGGNIPAGTYYYQFCYTIGKIEEMRTGQIMILK